MVYSTTPATGASQVLAYLSRYTYRVAISNRRLESFEGGVVRFRYKDRRNGGQERVMALPVAEFVRRFMQHVLPTRFVRVRHYGFQAGSVRAAATAKVRAAIGERPAAPIIRAQSWHAHLAREGVRSPFVCPECSAPLEVSERLSSGQLRWLQQGLATAT